ncbi:hypothetical protein KQI42_16745 [Tissierella sp. MSJ-40]|uniref:Uncharacterized protein n=1 Tax=Tissierella simiarum TaxID=2841534 RepID=A0ABS6E9Q6_9FIRM|nr:hypothetical protein [Tissierella simiarum]MBU5439665.1 hypothetical protein [Tissierella simiarum]
MVLANNNLYNIYEGLKHNFLFNNDINCIHILLNLYDLEENITNIYPKYVSINHIKKHITRYLKHRRDNHLISLNIGQLIHEDINRLELYIYLEGYKYGYIDNKWVNILEEETVKHFSIEELYDIKYLFHFDTSIEEISKLKAALGEEIHKGEKDSNYLYSLISSYCNKVIKNKVYSLNKFMDKQLTIEYNSDNLNIKEEEPFLTLEELNGIYKELVKIAIKNGIKLYKDAYWNGLNDRVLKRYS